LHFGEVPLLTKEQLLKNFPCLGFFPSPREREGERERERERDGK